jgi:hypothetical protein
VILMGRCMVQRRAQVPLFSRVRPASHRVMPVEIASAISFGTGQSVPCFTLPRTASAISFAASSHQGCIFR